MEQYYDQPAAGVYEEDEFGYFPGERDKFSFEIVLRKTPWWMLSIFIHLILISMFAILVSLGEDKGRDAGFETAISRPLKKQMKEEKDLFEQERTEEDKTPVKDPLVTEVMDEHDETDNDEEFEEAKGEDEDSDVDLTGKGDVDGIGIGGGAGAHFGGRRGGKRNLVKGGGGDDNTEGAVLAALRWLKRHQDPMGFWDCDGFLERCDPKFGAPCDGEGNMDQDADIGLTGLALLAYLGAGYTHDDRSEFADTVKRGLQFLVETQEENIDDEDYAGVVALEVDSQHFHYGHSIATLALCEAYALTGSILFQDPAQRAVDYVVRAQNDHPEIEGEKYGWRYYPNDGDNDTSVTGWMIMALKSARAAELEVPSSSFEGVRYWLDDMTDDSYFRTGYQTKGGDSAIPGEKMESGEPCAPTETCTAIAVISRIWLHINKTNAVVQQAAGLLAQDLPIWAPDEGKVDYYYWYYGTLAMFQVGGEHWKQWNANMKEALVDHQAQASDGCKEGSWESQVAKWGVRGSRVYATAINCLTLEVYYRYPKVFR